MAAGTILSTMIIKALIAQLLGDNSLTSIAADIVDLLRDRSIEVRQNRIAMRQIDTLTKRVAEQVHAVFAIERSRLEPASQQVVVEKVCRALLPLSPEVLAASGLESQVLLRYLNNQTAEPITLNANELALYQRLLREVCTSLVKEAPAFPDFLFTAMRRVFSEQEQLRSDLSNLVAQPSAADARLEAEYRQALIHSLDRLELLGVPEHDKTIKEQSLSLAYVSLQLDRRSKRTEGMLADEEFEDLAEQRHRVDFDRSFREPRMPDGPRDAADVVANNPRLIIRGEAGSGKSTLLRWLAVRLANQDCDQAAPSLVPCTGFLPVFIPLRKFPTTLPTLQACLFELSTTLPYAMSDWLHHQIKAGRGMILIDALDELPRAQRSAALEWIKDWIKKYPFARFVITSRPTALDSDPTKQDREYWPEWRE